MKPKILLLNDWMYGGGAEKSMSILANELSRKGLFEITLLMLENKISYKLDSNIRLLSFRNRYKFGVLSKLSTLLLDAVKLSRIIKKQNIDIVLSFQHRSNIINVLSKIFYSNYNCIISERVYTKDYFSNASSLISLFYNFMIKTLYNKADSITCNASDIKKGLIDYYHIRKEKIVVIENAYNIDEILKLSKEQILGIEKKIFDNGKNIIINVGRLNKQKGQKYLIEAFSLLKEKNKYFLVIIGDGDLKPQLKDQVIKLGLEKQVFFLGHKENPYKYLARSNIFVFPSLYEGYPNALAEAMIFKLKIIAFNFKSGATDLIQNNKYGYLVEMYNTKELAYAIEHQFKQDYRRLNTINDLINKYLKLFFKNN